MSCNRLGERVSKWASAAGGVPKVASRSAFYAGIGLGAGGAAMAGTRAMLVLRNARQQRVTAQLQQAARLGYEALQTSGADGVRLAQQARKMAVQTAKEEILPLKDKALQGKLVHFAADILEATDPEQIARPGNIVWAEEARRTLGGVRMVYLSNDGPGWKGPLAAGTAVGVAAVAGAAWLTARKRMARKLNNYITVVKTFYSQQDFSKTFDFKTGMELTGDYTGSQARLPRLKRVLGSGSQSRPLAKQGGEDDIYLLEGPRGHIHYLTPGDDGSARILAVIPRKGKEMQMSEALKKVKNNVM